MEKLKINDTIKQMDLTDIYRIFNPNNKYAAVHRKYSKTDSILGHKDSPTKYRKIQNFLLSMRP